MIDHYNFSADSDVPWEELSGISDQTQLEDIPEIEEIGNMVIKRENLKVTNSENLRKLRANIKDPVLRFVDRLLDDHIIKRLLSYKGYTPSKRVFSPITFSRPSRSKH